MGGQLPGGGLLKALYNSLQTHTSFACRVLLTLLLQLCMCMIEAGLRRQAYRLAGTVVPDNERERLVELDNMGVVRAEAPDALY